MHVLLNMVIIHVFVLVYYQVCVGVFERCVEGMGLWGSPLTLTHKKITCALASNHFRQVIKHQPWAVARKSINPLQKDR